MNQSRNISNLNQTINPAKPSFFGNTSDGFSWQDYFYLCITISGMLTNLVNFIVFFRIKLKDVRYKYMLWKSLANFFYLLLTFMSEIFIYCINCSSTKLFFSAFYLIYINTYLASCFAMFRILVELVLSFNTFLILKRRNWFEKIPYQTTIILLGILSLTFYAPKLPGFRISHNSITGTFSMAYTSFGLSQAFKIISITQSLVRVFLNVIALGFINVLNLIQFRNWFKRRRVGFELNPNMVRFKNIETKSKKN